MDQQAHTGAARLIGFCCLAVIGALYVVGFVVHEIVRHVIQTSPIWIGVILGFRGSPLAKWTSIPVLLFWGLISILIWLYLLGWAKLINGTYTLPEIAMTIVMAVAALIGLIAGLRMRSGAGPLAAILTLLVVAALQWAAFVVSFQPALAHDHF